MIVNEIEVYLNRILAPRIRKICTSISDDILEGVVINVRAQIHSIIRNWKDKDFRSGVLIIGLEEGFFYEPLAPIDVKCFIVVAIRNSLIEDLASCDFRKMGLGNPIGENDIKTVTQEAIAYFKTIDFKALSDHYGHLINDNVYVNIIDKYPVAWTALCQLAKMEGKKVKYEKVRESNPKGFIWINETSLVEKPFHIEVQSGISAELDEGLKSYLQKISDGEIQGFYIDSFKALTRNFEKLLKVIEFVLANDKAFVTSNYFITNGYIEKRETILRAMHTEREMNFKLKNLSGVGKKHKEFLKSLSGQIRDYNK